MLLFSFQDQSKKKTEKFAEYLRLSARYAVFYWQIFAKNQKKSVISLGPLKNPPMERADFGRFLKKFANGKRQ